MTIAINESVIAGGPLPEGNLCAYSYDPTTSCVYLTRLIDEPDPTIVAVKSIATGATAASISIPNVRLYPGILQLKFTSSLSGNVGSISLINDTGVVIFNSGLVSNDTFDTALLTSNTFGFKLSDDDIYTLAITPAVNSNLQLIELTLPTGVNTSTVYNGDFSQTPAITGIGTWLNADITLSNCNILNSSWGYIRKNGKILVVQTLAPFPPPFYDPNWFNPIDYAENTNYVALNINFKAQQFFSSETWSTTPNLSKVVKILDDAHAKLTPSCYSIALITQEDDSHQYMWRCIRQTRVLTIASPNTYAGTYTYYINTWTPSEKVYKYKAGGIYFGGKDYSGPLNSILVDSQDGINYTEYKILDLNEFPINSDNELFVHAYVCNYNPSSSIVYCVLNKQTGRMAEINVGTHQVKYFTVVVPIDNEICQLYYTNRLMYTIKNADNTVFSLYDANNNGILLYTFDLGTYHPEIIPQFTIIN